MMLLMCHIAQMRFALPVNSVVEVVGRPTFEPIPASPAWIAGSFVHRGVVTPVIDFAVLAQVGAARSLWSSRVIVLTCEHSGQSRRLGILFDRAHAEQVSESQLNEALSAAVQIWDWGKTLIDEHGTYCQLDLRGLLSHQRLAQLFPGSE